LVGLLEKVTYTIIKKKNNPKKDIKDPTDATKFQPAKASG
jgi:hypothetical protein